MLTQLRFKNWRSLKDATIDLTPITVFIGANSSGKTNILDGLYFIRSYWSKDIVQTVFDWKGRKHILTSGISEAELVELEFSYHHPDGHQITDCLSLQFPNPITPFLYGEKLLENREIVLDKPLTRMPSSTGEVRTIDKAEERRKGRLISELGQFVSRWQLLNENFLPALSLPSDIPANIYAIAPTANNVVHILNFMQQTRPELYEKLQEELRWLLGHVDTIETERTERETRLILREKAHKDHEAPTISAGTSRILAMLTAVYALDMRYADMPGLVVIEEPDTALNPWLLRNFVGQLREYVSGEHPRQFILTTHNPAFLNYFEPEEVRVVERDESGYTTVKPIPDYVREIWLNEDEYALGEVWTTNSFGGLAE